MARGNDYERIKVNMNPGLLEFFYRQDANIQSYAKWTNGKQ